MLKTRRGAQVWLITHPAHAELAGTMAAHWGNEDFARPGDFAPSSGAERLRQEVVLAVAQHDNGWWEWEANPPLSVEDGLPQAPGEMEEKPVAGMKRWLRGISRLAERHPYASLLIGDHARWFYAAQSDSNAPAEFTHQLQHDRSYFPQELETEARRFMTEVRDLQEAFQHSLDEDGFWRAALKPEHRHPHARLLQTLDALSLALCSDAIAPAEGRAKGLGDDHVVFQNVPRRSWDDRVSLEIKPLGGGRSVIDPYPFDETPLTVAVPARVAEPHTWWRRAPWISNEYTYLRN
jgi:hypothetical protein